MYHRREGRTVAGNAYEWVKSMPRNEFIRHQLKLKYKLDRLETQKQRKNVAKKGCHNNYS